jgi:formylglycine-generating enzyme required for sulfatase activity
LNRLFTSHLLNNLKTPGLSVFDVFDRTMGDVINVTNGTQNPELSLRYAGAARTFLGARPANPGPAPVVQPVAPPERITPTEMVRINGGTFTMGSPAKEPGRSDSEGPQRQVTVSSFFMGKYEVTQKEYQEVMGTNPSNFKGDNLPVENVSWFDAVEYCNKRSQREGLTPAYTINGTNVTWNRSANGYRLPTEAEWEYACRAGTTTAYNTGANIDNNTGWYKDNSNNTTHPVGQNPANAWGLNDMHGNVWEWCLDWYGRYSSNAQTDPIGASSGANRVIRGGCWNTSAQYVRSANRNNRYTPSNRYSFLGFRVARNGG